MGVEHSEMLIHNQEWFRILHISQNAKGQQNDYMDSRSIRLANLHLLIEEAGSKAELARRTGANESHLSQITTGVRNVGPALARDLEKGMDKPSGWMDLPQEKPSNPVTPHIWVPLISWTEADMWGSQVVANEANLKIPTTAVVGGRLLSGKCFALRVSGDSMVNPAGRPTYPPGCAVIVDPDRSPIDGDRVIVKIPNVNEPTLKVYTVDSGRVLLRAFNPQYPSLPWLDGMKVLGVVAQTIMDE